MLINFKSNEFYFVYQLSISIIFTSFRNIFDNNLFQLIAHLPNNYCRSFPYLYHHKRHELRTCSILMGVFSNTTDLFLAVDNCFSCSYKV